MKPIANFEEITVNDDFKKLPVGGYVCKIVRVNDNEDKKYLGVVYDIAEGDYKDYFSEDDFYAGEKNDFKHMLRVMYRDDMTYVLKGFTNAVDASNEGYEWKKQNWDEQSLVGKIVGVVFQEEEYEGTDGRTKTKFSNFATFKSVDDIRKGNFTVRECKKLKQESTPYQDSYSDIPFSI